MSKKFLFNNLIGVFLIFLSTALSAGAQTLSLDMSKGAILLTPNRPIRTPLVLTEIPSQKVKGWKIDWKTNDRDQSYAEWLLKAPIKLPAFKKIYVKVKFFAPAACHAHRIGLRFRDRNGEIFQFTKKVDFLSGGFFEEEWEITLFNFDGSWGGTTTDKVLDMPVVLSAMTVSFPKETGSGYFYLLGVLAEVQEEGKLLNVTKPVCLFDESSKFHTVGTGSATLENNLLKVGGIAGWCGIVERKFLITRYVKPPVKIAIDLELPNSAAESEKTSSKIRISANFVYADKANIDKDKTNFKFPEQPVRPGRQTITWNTADIFKDAKYPIRLSVLNIINYQKEKPVELLIHNITFTEEKTLPEAIEFDILTDTSVHVLRKNAEDSLKFAFKNPTDENAELLLNFTYKDFFGHKATEERLIKLVAGETEVIQPNWRPDTFGFWNVAVTIRQKSCPNIRAEKERSLAYFVPAGPTRGKSPGFLFSVCTHTSRWCLKDRLQEIEAASLCGIKVSRTSVSWQTIQPKRDVWNWEMLDFLVQQYGKKGIELQFNLSGTAPWALSPDVSAPKDGAYRKMFPDLKANDTFLRELCKRYRGKIRYYENRNEPDLTVFSGMTLQQYVALQKSVYTSLQKYDPDAIVMTGGFATLNRRHPTLIHPDFQRDFLAQANGYFHLHAFHAHGWFPDYVRQIDNEFLPIRKETGVTVPWYSNETAMTSVGGQERRQAEVLFKKLIFAWSRGAMGYTWYNLRNDGYDPQYGEHHFGMLTNDFYPKPVYAVYNALAINYSNMKYDRPLNTSKNVYLFSFQNGDTILVPGWFESSTGETKVFLMETNAEKAFLLDLMGNEKEIPIQNKRIVFEIGNLPQTLKLKNAKNVAVLGEILDVENNKEAIPGKKWNLDIIALNPGTRDSVLELSLSDLPDGLKFEKSVGSDRVENSDSNRSRIVYRKNVSGNGRERIRLVFDVP
ncbi:MAG: hypothetical protein PHQ75_10895, partial [Thermoguttaceae bacterium]|nr:hypothetical protein [Thermoguttaceae bacterium]